MSDRFYSENLLGNIYPIYSDKKNNKAHAWSYNGRHVVAYKVWDFTLDFSIDNSLHTDEEREDYNNFVNVVTKNDD